MTEILDPEIAELVRRLEARPEDPRVTWQRKARPEQRLPEGTWRIWFVRGGRGSGKTRSGAGGLAEMVLGDADGEGEYGIIAPTYADAWTKCVEGEAGILVALGTSMAEIKDHRSATVKSAWRTYGQVILHSGIIIYADSAAEGGLRIQGRNLKAAWADEVGLWEKWEVAWKESLVYAVRKGRAQIIATGTPKASRPARKLVRGLLRNDPEHGGVVNTRLRTIDNIANLAETFIRAVVGASRGTRLERQELEGELLDDVANALWTRDQLEQIRCGPVGSETGPLYLRKVYIGVDPSDGNENSDEHAYTVCGLGPNDEKRVYVAETWGGQEPPVRFAERVIRRALEWRATVVVEKNHGGKWLDATFKLVMKNMGVSVPIVLIHASDAKRTRAEPVSALYERFGGDLVRHCVNDEVKPCDCADITHEHGHVRPDEHLPELEDQMVTFTGAAGERSPDRLDSLVWAMTRYLRETFEPIRGKSVQKWAASQDLAQVAISQDERMQARRRRVAERAQPRVPAYGEEEWAVDDWAPQDDTGREDGRGNVHPWR